MACAWLRLLVLPLLLLSLFVSVSVSGRRVSLSVYYEALCPYCSNFIVNHLPRLFSSGLISAVDLDLVPYGNARLDANGTISCQHGRDECLLNTIEACAISVWPNVRRSIGKLAWSRLYKCHHQEHYIFIYCVEHTVKDGQYANWESCFQQTGFGSSTVVDCYNSGYGVEIELQYKTQTEALQPPHLYVPWVVVDGQPLYEDYENFEHYICKAYDDSPPKACEERDILVPESEKAREEEGPFCLVEGMTRSFRDRKKHKIELHN